MGAPDGKDGDIKEQFGSENFDVRKAMINLRAELIDDPRNDDPDNPAPEVGRTGAPAHWFSSVKHGDPATPLPHAYVGDPFVIRHLGVLDREAAIRITGHRFRLERFGPEGSLSDGRDPGALRSAGERPFRWISDRDLRAL